MLISPILLAQYRHPDEMMEQPSKVGPELGDVALTEVKETSPYGSEHPLAATIKNNSEYYLDRVAIECNITDDRNVRVFKDIVFQSNPTFGLNQICQYLPARKWAYLLALSWS